MILWKKGHASLDLLEKWVGSVLKNILCNKGRKQNNETFGKRMCIAFGKLLMGELLGKSKSSTAWKKQALVFLTPRNPLSMSLGEPLKERWFHVFWTSDHGQAGQKKGCGI